MNPADTADELLIDGEALVYEFDLEAPLDKVWHALTDPESVAAWMLPSPEEPGAEVELHLAACRPPHYIAYHWQAEDEPESLVTFELYPASDGGTHLRLTHQRAMPHSDQWDGPVALLQAA